MFYILLIAVLLQFIVRASDNRQPPGTSQASVLITVVRNEFGPVFGQNLYNITISEYHTPLTSVSTVTATDQDDPNVGNQMFATHTIKLFST